MPNLRHVEGGEQARPRDIRFQGLQGLSSTGRETVPFFIVLLTAR